MANDKTREADEQTSLAENSYRKAVKYVTELDSKCAYTHGYVCDDKRTGSQGSSNAVPGSLVRAWPAAYEIFMQQDLLTKEQKSLKHYQIDFRSNDDGDTITVLFLPLLLPQIVNGKPEGLMRATFGQETRITLDASMLTLKKVVFGR